MDHTELGSRILYTVIEKVGTHGKVETMARLESRNMTIVLTPEKKAVVKKSHERTHEDKHEEIRRSDAAAADDAEAAAQPAEPAEKVAVPQVAAVTEVQAPAEPVAEEVVETADPA